MCGHNAIIVPHTMRARTAAARMHGIKGSKRPWQPGRLLHTHQAGGQPKPYTSASQVFREHRVAGCGHDMAANKPQSMDMNTVYG